MNIKQRASKVLEVVDRLSTISSYLAGILILFLTLSMCIEVISRYVFNAPTFWAHEVSYMTLAAIFLFSIGEALRTEIHVRIDLIYGRLNDRGRALVNVLGLAILFLPGCWWISIELCRYAFRAYQTGMTTAQSAWNPVVWPFRTMMAVAFTLFSVQATVELLRNIARVLIPGSGNDQ
jgi:TRAP-type mannitol/chloroaromatic compound transport system permease small subunit